MGSLNRPEENLCTVLKQEHGMDVEHLVPIIEQFVLFLEGPLY